MPQLLHGSDARRMVFVTRQVPISGCKTAEPSLRAGGTMDAALIPGVCWEAHRGT